MQGRAYLAGHPTFVTTDIEHACTCEEFRRYERKARVVSARVVMAIPLS
jgi:hypothetical protein